MKKLCLMFNHFQYQDGVSRSALAYANYLVDNEYANVTLVPIYKDDKEFHKLLNPKVKVKPVFGFYFRGMSKIVNQIPLSWLNFFALNDNYDILIGFQESLSIKCVAAYNRNKYVTKFAWMHGYFDWILPSLKKYYEIIGTVVNVSQYNAKRLRSELPTVISEYCYNPISERSVIDQGKFPIEIEKDNEGILMTSVARMSPEKGFIRLIKILKRLNTEGYHFTFWFIGDGPQKQELELLVSQLHMEGCIKFLGSQNNPHKFTAKSDVFICSSFVEGYSTACTEAIMLGIPVITTSVPGAQEIIKDAECGIMTEKDDESLYKGILEVLQHPEKIKQWKKTLERTREKFNAEERIKKFIEITGLKKKL